MDATTSKLSDCTKDITEIEIKRYVLTWNIHSVIYTEKCPFGLKSVHFKIEDFSYAEGYLSVTTTVDNQKLKSLSIFLHLLKSNIRKDCVHTDFRIGVKDSTIEAWSKEFHLCGGDIDPAVGDFQVKFQPSLEAINPVIMCEIILRKIKVKDVTDDDSSLSYLAYDFHKLMFSETSTRLKLKDGDLMIYGPMLCARSRVFENATENQDINKVQMYFPEHCMSIMSRFLVIMYSGLTYYIKNDIPLLGVYECACNFNICFLKRLLKPTCITMKTIFKTWRSDFEGDLDLSDGRRNFWSPFFFSGTNSWCLRMQFCDDKNILEIILDLLECESQVFICFKFSLPNASGGKTVVGECSVLPGCSQLIATMSTEGLETAEPVSITYDLTFYSLDFVNEMERTENKWESFTIEQDESIMSSDYESLYAKATFSDMTVKAEYALAKVHRPILKTRSSYIAYLIDNNVNNTKELQVPGVSAKALICIIRFIYSGRLLCDNEIAVEIYEVAHRFRIGGMEKAFSRYLMNNLSLKNAFWLLELSDRYQDLELKQTAVSFMCNNYNIVCADQRWKMLNEMNSSVVKEVLAKLTSNCEKSDVK